VSQSILPGAAERRAAAETESGKGEGWFRGLVESAGASVYPHIATNAAAAQPR